MLLRRKIAFAVCATALTVPVLSSCGFNYATDKPYTPAAGTNNTSGTVNVLGVAVVAGQSDSGTFIAGLANNDPTQAITLTGFVSERLTFDVEPIEVPAGGFVNLADADIHVTGTFAAGDVVDLTLEFDNGDEVALEVPVVTNCNEFEGVDTSAEPGATNDDPAYSCEFAESEAGH